MISAANTRESIGSSAARLSVSALPNGSSLINLLQQMMSASATADRYYAAWASDVANCSGNAAHTANFSSARPRRPALRPRRSSGNSPRYGTRLPARPGSRLAMRISCKWLGERKGVGTPAGRSCSLSSEIQRSTQEGSVQQLDHRSLAYRVDLLLRTRQLESRACPPVHTASRPRRRCGSWYPTRSRSTSGSGEAV